jgi:hypothetical protein
MILVLRSSGVGLITRALLQRWDKLLTTILIIVLVSVRVASLLSCPTSASLSAFHNAGAGQYLFAVIVYSLYGPTLLKSEDNPVSLCPSPFYCWISLMGLITTHVRAVSDAVSVCFCLMMVDRAHCCLRVWRSQTTCSVRRHCAAYGVIVTDGWFLSARSLRWLCDPAAVLRDHRVDSRVCSDGSDPVRIPLLSARLFSCLV